MTNQRAIEGCLLGTAAGDSIGLPFENLPRRVVTRMMRLPLEQSLVFGHGLVSDDTEHTVMSAMSLLEAGTDIRCFQRRLAARLRYWLVALPPGVGGATARAILKLWFGFSPRTSGVRSAGNGPAMRSALLGILFGDDVDRLREAVRASTAITHTDPRAFEGALAVAVAAACAARLGPVSPEAAWQAFDEDYRRASLAPEVLAPVLAELAKAIHRGQTVAAFAEQLCGPWGVSGYMLHTLPVVLHAWMCHAGDFRQAVTAVVRCGGDTDSTAAIAGAIVGAGVGEQGIPSTWLSRICEWPRDVAWMRRLSADLASAWAAGRPSPSTVGTRVAELAGLPRAMLRNLVMLVVILCVLVRRILAHLRAAWWSSGARR